MSKGPKERLIEAKELYDMGILSEVEYAQIKSDCIAQMRGITTTPPPSLESDNLLRGETILDEDGFRGDDDVLGGATVALTVMGRAQHLTSENINKLPSGSLFDNRYSISYILGEGGMGVVYRAVDTLLKRDVALKAIHPELLKRKDIVDLLVREVQLSQRLSHPNILQIRHLELNEDAPYAIM